MDHLTDDLEFTCCFCSKDIVPNEVDPLNINIVGNRYEYKKKHGSLIDQPSQDYYCHFDCLKSRLDDLSGSFFLETNFTTDIE